VNRYSSACAVPLGPVIEDTDAEPTVNVMVCPLTASGPVSVSETGMLSRYLPEFRGPQAQGRGLGCRRWADPRSGARQEVEAPVVIEGDQTDAVGGLHDKPHIGRGLALRKRERTGPQRGVLEVLLQALLEIQRGPTPVQGPILTGAGGPY